MTIATEQTTSSIRQDGQRNFVHPADVKGRFTSLRALLFVVLIAIYVALPFIKIGGHPAMFLDLQHRSFYLFGSTFNAQDFWLVFFLVTGLAYVLFVLTSMWGRVWCGYACPQTVFLEGVYRRIERWVEGPRQTRLRRNAAPVNFDKVWRKLIKHLLFIAITLVLAHVFLSYFVSLPSMIKMVQGSPAEHPTAFAWVMAFSAVFYFNFSWFREQFCVIMCPYGRMQSVLTDSDTMVIGYDEKRGEPRGKVSDPNNGDCINCNRCVVVCPTGIDIRNGLQIDCIGCAACIDACDEIMLKIGRPKGLVRYDSLNGLHGEAKKFFRPRLWFYIAMGLIGLTVATIAFRSRSDYEANLLRMQGAPYQLQDGKVRNSLELHLVNKREKTAVFSIQGVAKQGQEFIIPATTVELESLKSRRIPVFVLVPRGKASQIHKVQLRIRAEGSETEQIVEVPFVSPKN
ncbi:MAG: cytochrome c oxidase accessory protein CcoG [Myxococcales bacterium]|nr:MAG: cytochrome c oxidase accessory protein CcoG [Myxococcales bacterium]